MLLVPFLIFTSCMEDKSAYLPQDKEDVKVDEVDPDEGGGEEPENPVDGELIPGVHQWKVTVNGVERRFKYFMPVSINTAKPISLIVSLHSGYELSENAEELPDPLEGITSANNINQLAIKENCIVVFPVGTQGKLTFDEEEKDYICWSKDQYQENIPYIDALVEYMKRCTPTIDPNRIYATGFGDGAVFSSVLGIHRSNVFAAIAPFAQIRDLKEETFIPSRAIPARFFFAEADEDLKHTDALDRATVWAEKIGGSFPQYMKMSETPLEISDYNKKVDMRTFNGARSDIEIYTVKEEKDVSEKYLLPYAWEFFKSHTLDKPEALFVTIQDSSFVIEKNQTISVPFNYTQGATIDIDYPQDWNITISDKVIHIVGPDFYDPNIENVDGDIILTVTRGGKSVSTKIGYKLVAPLPYFTVGEIYYSDDFKPAGVVAWVNSKNRGEAKIVSLTGPGAYDTSWFGGNSEEQFLGKTFSTPDMNDGKGNTNAMVERNKGIQSPNTASTSAYMWANEYEKNGVKDWYLPAIEEYADFASKLDRINAKIVEFGGRAISGSIYSSTVTIPKENNKWFYYYNFATKQIEYKETTDTEYFGFISVRAMKKVTK